MKFSEFKRYFSIFILAVALIAVYKTFDNLDGIFSAIGSFFSMISPIIYAFGIAFLLYPLCARVETFIDIHTPVFFQKRARVISVLSVYVFVFFIIGGIIYMMLPAFTKSIVDFIKMIPYLLNKFVNKLNQSKYIYIDLNSIDKYIDVQKFLSESGWLKMEVYTSKILNLSVNFVKIILSVITSIYILLDRKSLLDIFKTFGKMFIKKGKFSFIRRYGMKAIEFSYKYIFCVLTDAIIIFVLSLVIMLVMRIDHAVVLALMLGVFNIVPYFGAILACVISVIITLMTANFTTAIILAIILFALQQVDCNVIQPHLIKDSLEIRPFWVLVGILIGGGLFGVWGIVAAIPVMALIKTIINDYMIYIKEKNERKSTLN